MASTRRSFLAAAATTAGAVGLSACQSTRRHRPLRDPGQPARLMVIGVGGRGADNLAGVAKERIAILCDIDRNHLETAAKQFPDARLVHDYRTILRDAVACQGLDGVVVSTPDHTHYLPTMLALQQGLDVYCEKPLTQTIGQARRLLATARANGCVTQMGIQIHANANYRRVVEAIRGGAVGSVREVVVFVNGTAWSATELPATENTPAHVAWDEWVGPSALRAYSPGYHPASWRRYWAFGGGTTADMGCHFVDLAFWALDLDAPTSLLANGPEPHPECAPDGLRCEFGFPARSGRQALTLRWHAQKDRPEAALAARGLEKWTNGVLFLGDDGWLISDYNRHEVGPEARKAVWKAPTPTLEASPGHYREWLRCSALRTQPTCSFEYAVPLTETVLLANLAFRAARGKRVEWNAAAMQSNDAALNALLDLPARDGFSA